MGNTSHNHVRRALHLHLTMWGTHPATMLEGLYTYIWPWGEHIPQPCQKGSPLASDHGGNTSRNHVRKALHLHLTMEGTHLATMSEGFCTYIWPCGEHILQPCQKVSKLTYDHVGNTSRNHVRRASHLYPTMGGPTYHHVRKALGLSASPWKEPTSR